jgi:hypothetical protein
MKKIYICGDIQFDPYQVWQLKAGDMFLDWFSSYNFGQKDEIELLQLGDLFENMVNPGTTIAQAERFAAICQEKFKHTYILQGNHDIRLYKDRLVSALEFLKQKPGFTIIEEPSIINTELGFKFIALPFKRYDEATCEQIYTDKLPDCFYEEEADFIAAHCAETNINIDICKTGVNFQKFKTKTKVLGHIHTRVSDIYPGSTWPKNHTQEDDAKFPRCIKVLTEKTWNEKEWNEILLPEWVKFKTVEYPNPVADKNDNIIEIYSVKNCNNLQLAKSFYKDIYVNKIERVKTEDIIVGTEKNSNILFTFEKPVEALDSYINETKAVYSRPLYNLLRELLA